MKNMNKKIFSSLLIIFCFLFINITIEASSINVVDEINLIAGDDIDIEYIITYTGSSATNCYVEASIVPNGTGINLTYASVFTLYPNQDNIYIINFNTSMLLASGNYSLSVTFSVDEQQTSSSSSSQTTIRGIYVYPSYSQNDNEPSNNNNDDKIPDEVIPTRINIPEPKSNNIFIIIGLFLLFFVIFIYVIYRWRHKKHEKNK